jgi:hypothetical protein
VYSEAAPYNLEYSSTRQSILNMGHRSWF